MYHSPSLCIFAVPCSISTLVPATRVPLPPSFPLPLPFSCSPCPLCLHMHTCSNGPPASRLVSKNAQARPARPPARAAAHSALSPFNFSSLPIRRRVPPASPPFPASTSTSAPADPTTIVVVVIVIICAHTTLTAPAAAAAAAAAAVSISYPPCSSSYRMAFSQALVTPPARAASIARTSIMNARSVRERTTVRHTSSFRLHPPPPPPPPPPPFSIPDSLQLPSLVSSSPSPPLCLVPGLSHTTPVPFSRVPYTASGPCPHRPQPLVLAVVVVVAPLLRPLSSALSSVDIGSWFSHIVSSPPLSSPLPDLFPFSPRSYVYVPLHRQPDLQYHARSHLLVPAHPCIRIPPPLLLYLFYPRSVPIPVCGMVFQLYRAPSIHACVCSSLARQSQARRCVPRVPVASRAFLHVCHALFRSVPFSTVHLAASSVSF
ncbi:hypothetical protein C8Q79DRAFT_570409 [Trametes meyenii]|nr:hypothetical protein C8Q79DRAFT_570409 [Trametes meyenii]